MRAGKRGAASRSHDILPRRNILPGLVVAGGAVAAGFAGRLPVRSRMSLTFSSADNKASRQQISDAVHKAGSGGNCRRGGGGRDVGLGSGAVIGKSFQFVGPAEEFR
jgi:hypothetical protein